ncbi:MAG: acyl carrier protein [Planctomycetes bacterium]|nr:acyl carrier protein [Planctomycetota bacterium]
MRYRSSKTIKREFLESCTRQSKQDFLTACELTSESANNALKVRDAIANLGGVDAEYVRAEHTFMGDLIHFDFWGSLDSVGVVLELEKCLGIVITDEVAAQIPDPEAIPGFTVAEFVRSVSSVVQERKG